MHLELSSHLSWRTGRREEAQQALAAAVAAERAAVRSRPGDATAHTRLGDGLSTQGKVDEAEAAFREAIRLQPDWAAAHGALGAIMWLQGRHTEAEAAAREAVRLGPEDGNNNLVLGHALMARGKLAEAEAQYRAAIRIRADLDTAWRYLGRVLEHQGKPAEAEAAYREAVRLPPGDGTENAAAHCWLGELLRRQGRMDEALASLRRAATLAETMPWFASLVAADIRLVERQVALAPRLPAVLKGEDRPDDAARLYADALASTPRLADDRAVSPRLAAARAAALAGCGKGRDDPRPDAEARTRLRRQALDWLEEERAAWAKAMGSGDPNGRKQAGNVIVGWIRWTIDPDLVGVREPEALEALPEA